MIKKIKNNSGETRVWVGQQVEAGEYYLIPAKEYSMWAYDDQLIVDIANGVAIVNDGTNDLLDISNAIAYLQGNLPVEVVTQFEKNDKTLKICSDYADVGQDGTAKVLIKVPGTIGVDKRYIDYGLAWFNEKHPDDRVKVFLVDHDNILGYGVDFVVGSYTETEVPERQQGWRIPYHQGVVEAKALDGYGEVPSGFYIMIIGIKGGSATTGRFYVNIAWGKQSDE